MVVVRLLACFALRSKYTMFDAFCLECMRMMLFRYLPFMEKALQNFVSIYHPDYAQNERGTKDFHVSFYGLPEVDKLRELMTDKIGHLVSVSGTVTRTSEVRPELVYGHFKCNECGYDVPNVEQQFKFVQVTACCLPCRAVSCLATDCAGALPSCTTATLDSPSHCHWTNVRLSIRYTEPTTCRNPECPNKRSWELDLAKSKFVDWQRVKCQENPSEIPAGSMPRSMDLIMRNEAVELVKAGDKCIFTGTLVVMPDVAQLCVAKCLHHLKS